MRALEKSNESLEIAKRMGDQSGIAVNVHELGNIYHRIRQYNAALQKCTMKAWKLQRGWETKVA